MAIRLANNATGRLAVSADASTTTLSLLPGDAQTFPDLVEGDWFPMTLVRADGQYEIMRCTAKSGPVLTVVRGQEGTSPKAFNAGDRVEIRLTSAAFSHMVEDTIGASIDALNLGNASTRNVGTTTGTVAAGDDSRITGAAQKAQNLADIPDKAAARTNLGLAVFATRAPTYNEVTGKPATYPPATHGHTWADLTGAPVTATRWPAFSEVTAKPSVFPTNWANVANKPAQATRWPSWAEITGKPATFPAPAPTAGQVGAASAGLGHLAVGSYSVQHRRGTQISGDHQGSVFTGSPPGAYRIMGRNLARGQARG